MYRSNRTRSSNVDAAQPTRSGPALARRLYFTVLSAVALVSTSLVGCAPQPSPATATPSIADRAHPVPSTAQGHFPRALIDSLGTLRAEDDTSLSVVRSMLKVLFKGGVAQRERQQAIDLVGGIVVGGFRFPDGDGDYYVQIPGPTYRDIQAAIRKLEVLPQIVIAAPFLLGGRLDDEHVRPQRDSAR